MSRWAKKPDGWSHKATEHYTWSLTQSRVSRAWTLYKSMPDGSVVRWWDAPIPYKKVKGCWVCPKRADSRRWSMARARKWANTIINGQPG